MRGPTVPMIPKSKAGDFRLRDTISTEKCMYVCFKPICPALSCNLNRSRNRNQKQKRTNPAKLLKASILRHSFQQNGRRVLYGNIRKANAFFNFGNKERVFHKSQSQTSNINTSINSLVGELGHHVL